MNHVRKGITECRTWIEDKQIDNSQITPEDRRYRVSHQRFQVCTNPRAMPGSDD